MQIAVVVLIVLIFLTIFLVASSVFIVKQQQNFIIERFGKFHKIVEAGIHLKIPIMDKISHKIDIREVAIDYPPQGVITEDNVTMRVDTVIYYKVSDPLKLAYTIQNPTQAIENLTATALRNVFGELALDKTLNSRDYINQQMRLSLDSATDPWGIKITRVEIKTITPPQDIQQSMEKQMKAEREKRATILQSEGYKASQILEAEGEKARVILQAEAQREAQIKEAEGRAEAIIMINKAKADGLKFLKEAQVDDSVVRLKSLETLEVVANGNATKIFMPSDLQNVAAASTVFGEMANITKTDK